MKKQLLLALMLLVVSVTTMSAYDFEVDGICYNILSDHEAEVTYKDLNDSPLYYDDGEIIFYTSYYTGEVIVPESVNYDNVTYSVVSVGSYAFYNCLMLTSVDLPSTVTSIGERAFAECSALAQVVIPNTVESMGYGAFGGCRSLTHVDFPSSLTELVDEVFCSSGLTDILIPAAITSISSTAFMGCVDLATIAVDAANPVYDSRDQCNAIIDTETDKLVTGCRNSTIPNTVLIIGYGAFKNCTGLNSIVIGNSVTTIESEAFSGCRNLAEINLPSSVTTIGYNAFLDCKGLQSIFLPASVTSVDNRFLEGCDNLVSIIVDSDNPEYDSRENCNAIIHTADNSLIVGCKTSSIPSSVTRIGSCAFENCKGLTEITIPGTVLEIGNNAFAYCDGMTSVVLSDGLTTIERAAFLDCTGLTSINIPNTVSSMEWGAFWGCRNLSEIGFPESLVKMADGVFSYTKWLDNQPNGLVYIGRIFYCYKGEMPEQTVVTVEEGTLGVAGEAIYGFNNAFSVVLPNSLLYIGEKAFGYCRKLTSVTFGNSIEVIDKDAFGNDIKLTEIILPNSIKEIGWGAFQKCTNVKKVSLGKSLKRIGGQAFEYSNITEVVIPDSVTFIGQYAFYSCSNLKRVVIGSSVSKMYWGVFLSDKYIDEVTCKAQTPPEIVVSGNLNTFDCYTRATLYVPQESVAAYKSAFEWKRFTHIQAIPDSTPGDINGDGKLTINDVTDLIFLLLSDGELPDYCDVNGDGRVNITDVTTLIEMLLNGN